MNQPLSTATALTIILQTWRIWRAPNASKWQMGFNLAFKGLIVRARLVTYGTEPLHKNTHFLRIKPF
jgi:hypothetical protein